MKELFISLLIAIQGFLGFGNQNLGATVLPVAQGGTGATSFNAGECLKGNGTGAITTGSCGTGGGGSGGGSWSTTTSSVSGQLINYPNNNTDIVTIGSSATTSAEFYYDPNVFNLFVKSASSTIAGPLDIIGNFRLPSLSQGFAYIGSGGKVNTVATSSILLSQLGGSVTDAQVPDTITVNLAGTATALAANGANCSAGSLAAGVDASGASEGCTDVWTEAENTSAGYVAGTRTLTVAGTANQITSSAGAQDLTANRTWTLSFPNQVIFPGYASSTGFSSPYASSTFNTIGTLTFGGVTGSAWSTFCTAITGSASLCDGDDATGAGGGITTLGALNQGQTGSTQTFATSTTGTDFTITSSGNTHTWNLPVASASNSGKLSSTDWTTFNNKLTALGSGYATTTQSAITFSTSTASFNGLTIGGRFVPTAGALTFTPTLTGTLDNTGLTNSTISGIALGSNLANLTATNNTLTFSGTYNGGTARTVGLNLSNPNTWTVNQTFNYSSSTDYSSFNVASTTNLNIGGDSFIDLTGNGLSISGGSLTTTLGTTIAPNELVGTPSAANSILGLNSAGTGFVATGTADYLTVYGINTTSSTATSTFAGRLQIGTTTPLAQGSATFSVKGLMNVVAQFFTSAGTKIFEITDAGVASFVNAVKLLIPASANPTVDTTGQLAIDTTAASSSLAFYDGTAERRLYPDRTGSVFISTSTLATMNGLVSTSTIEMRAIYRPTTLVAVSCKATTTGTAYLDFGDGVNWTNLVTCNTTGAWTTMTTNNTFTMGEMMKFRLGTQASITQGYTISYVIRQDAD